MSSWHLELRDHLARHAVARLDGALHATGPHPVVGVFAREEPPSVEGRRDEWQHRVSLVAARRPDDRACPRVVRPALTESEQALGGATYDGAQAGVGAVGDLA